MNISPKHFLLGMVVGFVIFFTSVKISETKQKDSVMATGIQDESMLALAKEVVDQTPTPTPTTTPIATPSLTPMPTQIPKSTPVITPTTAPTTIPTVIPTFQPFNAISLVSKYAQEYGVDEHVLFTIGQCESGFNATSTNGPYGGIYQFHYLTWATIRNSMGLDPNPDLRFNPEESIRTAAFKIARNGTGAWPACSSGL